MIRRLWRIATIAALREHRRRTNQPLTNYAAPRIRFDCPDCGQHLIDRPLHIHDILYPNIVALPNDQAILDAHPYGCPHTQLTWNTDDHHLYLQHGDQN